MKNNIYPTKLNGLAKFAILVALFVLVLLTITYKPLFIHPAVIDNNNILKSENTTPIYVKSSLDNLPTKAVHVFDAVSNGSDLIAVWYGGTKEAKPDVALFMSNYSSKNNVWSEPKVVMTRQELTRATGRMTILIGNAVLVKNEERLALFFVSVGAGGWAASSLNVMFSENLGESWGKPIRLITSPFNNFSTLVRNPPIWMDNGLILIPAYHESLNQYSELIWVDENGSLVNKTRVLTGFNAIQPVLFTNSNEIHLLHRSMNPSLPRVISRSADLSSWTWRNPVITKLPNSDSAMAGLQLEEDLWLLAYNHAEKGRQTMDLTIKRADTDWAAPINMEVNPGGRLGYPALVKTDDGFIHLFYTVDRKFFRHIRFNQAWLESNYD